jgi:hypothetical protein
MASISGHPPRLTVRGADVGGFPQYVTVASQSQNTHELEAEIDVLASIPVNA